MKIRAGSPDLVEVTNGTGEIPPTRRKVKIRQRQGAAGWRCGPSWKEGREIGGAGARANPGHGQVPGVGVAMGPR